MNRGGVLVGAIVAVHWLAIAGLTASVVTLLIAATGVLTVGGWVWAVAITVAVPAVVSDWLLGRCFLTLWENRARQLAGWPTYSTSFFEHYAPIIPAGFIDGAIKLLRLSAIVGVMGLVWG